MSDLMFIEQSPMEGKERPFQPNAVIGREGAEIVLQDPEISRRHARLVLADGGPAIEDLGSTNGTFVNGERIQGVRALGEGDTVQVGGTVWRVSAPAGATQVAAAQPAAAGSQAAAAPSSRGASRGDVPAPDPSPPSAVRRALPAQPQHVFNPAPSSRPPRGGSAARRAEANIYSLAMTAAAAAGVIIFLIAER